MVVCFYRLKWEGNGGAWCPKGMISNDGRQYLEVNLQGTHAVTAVKSQGRYGNGSGKEFVEEMMIDYWRPGFNKWARWKGRDGKQASDLIYINIYLYIFSDVTREVWSV